MSSHHLLAPLSPSTSSSQQKTGSPSSPAITGGFNCLCISNNSALGTGRMPGHPFATIPNDFSLLETIPSLRLTEPEVELSASPTSHHQQQPLVSHPHVSDPHTSHPRPHASKPHTSHPHPHASHLHTSHPHPHASDPRTQHPHPHASDPHTQHPHPHAFDTCTSHPHSPSHLDVPIKVSSPNLDVSLPTRERFQPDDPLELVEPWDVNFSPTNLDPSRELSAQPTTDEAPSALDPDHSEEKPKPKPRIIYINNPSRTNDRGDFSGNKVRTNKYTWLTFLPKNLFEQFRRVAYIYFLVIVALNQIPQLAVFGRTASLFPLLFVLVITAIKDGYEDWGRHRSDVVENNRIAQVFSQGEFRPKKWKKIEVGEVVKVDAGTPVPCDIVLLATSDSTGVAYIQTLNLDGESNLKTRYAMQETQIQKPEINPSSGVVVCEPPTRNIYEFSANLEERTQK